MTIQSVTFAEQAKSLFFEGIDRCDANDYASAEPLFREALRLVPGRVSVLTNLAVALLRQRKFEDAADIAEQAITAGAGDDQSLLLTATSAHHEIGNNDRAVALFKGLVEHAPDDPNVWLGLGASLEDSGRFDEATAAYDRLERFDHIRARLQRARLNLRLGNYQAGWPDHELRLQLPDQNAPDLAGIAPRWTGEPLENGRILIHFEQGHGDVIQFLRYVPLVAGRGGEVALLVPPLLRDLVSESFPEFRQLVPGSSNLRFDFSASLMSLPHIFGHNTERSFPNEIPYLRANRDLVAKWSEHLNRRSGLKVGIVWQGNTDYGTDTTRSIPLACFRPLCGVPGVRLISLQAINGLDQLDQLPTGMTVERLGREIENDPDGFRELAAVMENLDLVVTSDTAPAHLAGAMGRPVFLALRAIPEWRWLLDREDSPWYPTMRIFRQQKPGDWAPVFAAIGAAVTERAAG